MPATSSSTRGSAPPAPTPSNRVLVAAQSQWLFTDAELYRTPSILDGMTIEAEHTSRSKGVNFITQVGILLKLPQLTLCTASVYLHRFFMRYSMKDLPQRPGMHPYSIAATALFLATKVEENCRKMKELIVACCRIAQKKPSMVVDEQSKEFWRWRDTILHNEDTLLEALCFDLQLEQPYRLLYDFLCYFKVQDKKRLRNSAWAFLNDSTYTVLCVQFPARTIAAAALYAAARHCEVTFEDDSLNRPWWEQLDVDLNEMRRACNRMADIYEFVAVPVPGQQYVHLSTRDDEPTDRTRTVHHPKSEGSVDISAENSVSPGEINGRKRERDSHSGFSQHPISVPPNGAASGNQDRQPFPKRQRREGSDAGTETSSFNQPQPSSSQVSLTQGASNLNLASNPSSQTTISDPSSQRLPEMNGHGHPRNASPPKSRIPQAARIPLNQQRRQHPLPPPPPVTVPPLPHQHPQPPRRGSYGNNPQPPNRQPPPRGPPSATGSSVFHPPPPPSSNPRNVDELQQRIDAIIQQGMPPENERSHEPRGDYYYRPSSNERERDRDRYRERDIDRNGDRDRDRYRDNDGDRDRAREKGRDHDHNRSRRHSSETSGSAAMSASLSAPSLSGTLPHPHPPPAPPSSLIPPAPASGARRDIEQDQHKRDVVETNTAAPQENDNKVNEPDDGGGSEEGEV